MRKACSRQPCIRAALPGGPRCAEHEGEYNRGKAQRRNRGDGNGAQRRLRRKLNNYSGDYSGVGIAPTSGALFCAKCGVEKTPAQLEVDHILPLADGGSDFDHNVWAICIPCHRAKTAAEATERARG